jgi:ADP-ribose pyrophosphatase
MTKTDQGQVAHAAGASSTGKVASRVVFQTDWFELVEEDIEGHSAYAAKPFYALQRPDGLIVLPITREGQIVLVRQYRPALRQYTLELPCGHLEPGEAPGDAAARELFEETGFRCGQISSLGSGRIMLDRVRSREYLFLVRDAWRDPAFEPLEEIEVVLKSPEELKQLVLAGQFEQLATLGAILLAEWKCGYRFANAGACSLS